MCTRGRNDGLQLLQRRIYATQSEVATFNSTLKKATLVQTQDMMQRAQLLLGIRESVVLGLSVVVILLLIMLLLVATVMMGNISLVPKRWLEGSERLVDCSERPIEVASRRKARTSNSQPASQTSLSLSASRSTSHSSPVLATPSLRGTLDPSRRNSTIQTPLDMDLVVPAGSECCLVVPIRQSFADLAIVDRQGHTILNAMAMWDNPRASTQFCLPWMQLVSVSGHMIADLAKVKAPGRSRFMVCRPGFELFGQLTPSAEGIASSSETWPQEYKFQTVVGDQCMVFGDVKEHRMHVMGTNASLMAVTEPINSESYSLRVAALADVGLILSILLSLEYLG